MASFRWSAINPGGEVVSGIIEAPDRGAVIDRLQRQGQIVLRAEEKDGSGWLTDLLQIEIGARRALDRAALSEVTRELAMIYPIVLIIAAIGSIVLLLDYVLPQFTPIFEQAGAELPASTRALMVLGQAVGAATPWLLLAILAATVLAPRALATPALRLKWDRLVLRLPIAGRLLRETLAARLTRTLGTLLQNGMPLIAALAITRDALGNLAAVAAIDAASLEAKAGRGLARPLDEAGLFPARTIHLLQLGEAAAQLPAMCLKAAEIHDEQARLIVQRVVALAIPIITIVMGLAVAG